MADHRKWTLPNGAVVHAAFSERADGDLALGLPAAELTTRRAALAPHPWTWLSQVHGARVVTVTTPGEHAGEQADSSVTCIERATLSVQVADCAPVLLFAPVAERAVVAAAHAGWKGIEAGVLGATVAAMRDAGASEISWILGPCISAGAYEFSESDLDRLVGSLGESVRATTAEGRPALDMGAAVAAGLADSGVHGASLVTNPRCTATSGRHWSYRAAGDTGRQVGAIWWEAEGGAG